MLGFPSDARITFLAWHSWALLHAWMVCVRMRGEGMWAAHRQSQGLMDALWADCERTIVQDVGISHPALVNRNMRSMQEEYLAAFLGYDEALIRHSDRMLAEALFRNLYRDTRPYHTREWSLASVARCVEYVRANMEMLDRVPSDMFANGFVPFLGLPSSQQTKTHR